MMENLFLQTSQVIKLIRILAPSSFLRILLLSLHLGDMQRHPSRLAIRLLVHVLVLRLSSARDGVVGV